MDFEHDGVRLHVEEEGSGEPVVLLHGHSLDLTVWDAHASAWAAVGWRVIRYDQRGHGRSSSPPCGYRWGDHAADLAALVRALGAAPAHLVGLSKGGGIAVELALRAPELVRSLVLIGPLLPDYPLSPELVDSFRRFARAIRAEGVARAVREEWLGHPLIASAAAHPEVGACLVAMVERFPAGEYLATARDEADRAWRAVERLGEIAVPTTVIGGELDVPDFVAMARLAAERIAGARLEVVPGCGHLVPVERAEETVRLVLTHLDHAASTPAGGRTGRRP